MTLISGQQPLYERSHGGGPVELYQRAVRYGDRAMATPEELRAAIGGTDADFDACIAARPAAREWLVAWATLHPDG